MAAPQIAADLHYRFLNEETASSSWLLVGPKDGLSSSSNLVQDAVDFVDHRADFLVGPKHNPFIEMRDCLARPLSPITVTVNYAITVTVHLIDAAHAPFSPTPIAPSIVICLRSIAMRQKS